MTDQGGSSWVIPSTQPRRGRGCVVLGLAVVALLLAGLAVLGIAFFRSPMGHGLGAAAAIYDHGGGRVYRADYREISGQAPEMAVYLAVGVDPGEARSIGCGVVADELAKAGLAGLHWAVYAANGEPVADSSGGCP